MAIEPASANLKLTKCVYQGSMDPSYIPAVGEVIVEKDEYSRSVLMKIGDGNTPYYSLPIIDMRGRDSDIDQLMMQANQTQSQMDLLTNENANLHNLIGQINERINNTIFVIEQCHRCSATLEIPQHKGIFHCKYCGAAYALGPIQLYSTYH